MKTISLKKYKFENNLTYEQLADMWDMSRNHMSWLASKDYTVSTSEDGLTSVLASEKNIFRIEKSDKT